MPTSRRAITISIAVLFTVFTILIALNGQHSVITSTLASARVSLEPLFRPPIRYKPKIIQTIIRDNFEALANATSASDLPPIPRWNEPGNATELTPLFIGFTRNWPMLQQAVVSYIAAGWPPSEIYIVDNTGTMDSNRRGLLTIQNPFYLNYRRLTEVFGVNVITLPTYFSFAQLQNFFLYIATENKWDFFFWSHMDIIVIPDERQEPFTSLYHRAIEVVERSKDPSFGKWAVRWFSYDHLTLVNTAAYADVGGFDTMIPYYGTDCDMHERLRMAGYILKEAFCGFVFDVNTVLPDLTVLFRQPDMVCPSDTPSDSQPDTPTWDTPPPTQASYHLNDCRHQFLISTAESMQQHKSEHNDRFRNIWQVTQTGGQGEPYYRDPLGFQESLKMTYELGKNVMARKWGLPFTCDLRGNNRKLGDEWRIEYDRNGQWVGW